MYDMKEYLLALFSISQPIVPSQEAKSYLQGHKLTNIVPYAEKKVEHKIK
jgi:hypothetical protein